MRELSVYNLEFPAHINTLTIAGYAFKRVASYKEAFAGLQHKIEASGGEFPIKPNTGMHQKTAIVGVPDAEETCILPWQKDVHYSKLQDILLLLSLFTGRNVFALNPDEEGYPLRPDPRSHMWGGQLRLSAIEDAKYLNRNTGEIRSAEEIKKLSAEEYADYDWVDFGLEKTICHVLNTITLPEWQNEYGNGYFLFTFRQAIQNHYADGAFILCWTILEHFFTVHNRHWLDDSSIDQMSGEKKIAFVLCKYLKILLIDVDIDDTARSQLKKIARARNRLVHFGPIPNEIDIKEMEMFIRLTEQIVAISLRLTPSNAFNSLDHVQNFLRGQGV